MRLLETNLAEDLEKPEYAPIRRLFSATTYKKHALVFQPREARNRMFVLRSGRVRVYLAHEDKEFTLAILEPGGVFSTHTRAFVQALEDSVLLEADIAEVGRFLLDMPSLAAAMVKVLGDLLSCSISIIEGLAFKDVRRRLVEMLLYEAGRTPRDEECAACGGCGRGRRLSLGLNTEQLASIIGSTRQTVSSLLNSLVREGLVERRARGVLCVPEPARLEAELEE